MPIYALGESVRLFYINVEIHKLERRVAINRVEYVYIMNNKPFLNPFVFIGKKIGLN